MTTELRQKIRGYLIYAMDKSSYSRYDMDIMLYALDNIIHEITEEQALEINQMVRNGDYDFSTAESRQHRIKTLGELV